MESEVLRCNKQAMEKLREGETISALTLLNEAQEQLKFIHTDSQVWAITFNNLGCYFKKTNDNETALKHFYKALEIEIKRPQNTITLAGTYLNINSIYSAQNLHDKALSYGLKALSLLLAANDKDNNVWTSLIVSYHTVGQEYEFLNRKQEALNVYRNGLDVAKEKLGKNHNI